MVCRTQQPGGCIDYFKWHINNDNVKHLVFITWMRLLQGKGFSVPLWGLYPWCSQSGRDTTGVVAVRNKFVRYGLKDLIFVTAEAQSVCGGVNLREVIIQNNDTMFYSTLHVGSMWETSSFLILRGVIKSMAVSLPPQTCRSLLRIHKQRIVGLPSEMEWVIIF